jgi:hypothetical protein
MTTPREKARLVAEVITADMRRRALLGATDAALRAQAEQWQTHMAQIEPLLDAGRCPECAARFVSSAYPGPANLQRFQCPECKRFFLVHRAIAAILLDVDERSLPAALPA